MFLCLAPYFLMREPWTFVVLQPFIGNFAQSAVFFKLQRKFKQRSRFGRHGFLVTLGKIPERLRGTLGNADVNPLFCRSHTYQCIKSVSPVNRRWSQGLAQTAVLIRRVPE